MSCARPWQTSQALEKVKQSAAEEMAKIAGGMNLPGLTETLAQLGEAGGESR